MKIIQQLLMFQPKLDVLGGEVFMQQVTHPECISSGFIHIGRTNTLEGAANFAFAFLHFRCFIQRPMGRYNDIGALRNEEVLFYINAICSHCITFPFKGNRI